jgi:hypothetical protein
MSVNNNAPALSPQEKVIEYITVSSTALEKAAAFEKAAADKQTEVDALIPSVCDVMVQHERIQPNQREKLAAALKDPARALELLIKVAGHRNKDEIARLGSGIEANGQVKQASANGRTSSPSDSLNSPNVGARTTAVKQSDVNFFKGLGIAAPTGN